MTPPPAGGPLARIGPRCRTRAAGSPLPLRSPCGSIRPSAAGTCSWARACSPPTCPLAPEPPRGSACGLGTKAPGSRPSSRATIIRGTRTRIRTGSTTPLPPRGGPARRSRRARIWWRRGGRNSASGRRRPRAWPGRGRIGRAQAAGGAAGGMFGTRLSSQRPPPKSRSSERIEARLSVASAVTAISVGPRTAANFPSRL